MAEGGEIVAERATLGKPLLLASWVAVCATGARGDTISFQNGFNGYNGTVQIRISSPIGPSQPSDTGGSINDPDFVMCRKYVPDVTRGSTDFWLFDNIVGTAPGQIPPNATILSARLELRTCSCLTGPTPQHGTDVTSPGPMCLARMLDPNVAPPDENRLTPAHLTLTQPWGVCGSPYPNWCPITSIVPAPPLPLLWVWYDQRKGDVTTPGPDYQHGDFDRPAGGFIDMTVCDRVESADVTSIVQEWTNGAANYGFVMFADTTNAWMVEGTGVDYHFPDDLTRRPKLVVEYSPVQAQTFVFQQGTDGYAGCSMLRVGQDGTTVLGSAIDPGGAFLDGGTGPTDPEFDAIIRFGNIFGSAAGQIPANTSVLKAYLAVTTPPETNDANAHSSGPFNMHRMLVDVDWTGANHPAKPFLWSEFASGDGPTVADNEISAAVSSAQAMTFDGKAFFDITSTVQAWKAGSPNYGLAIKPGTTDGWKMYWTSANDPALRPQLVIMVARRVPDLNGDGHVNAADFDLFRTCASGAAVPSAAGCSMADFDDDGDIDMLDFALFQTCYSGDLVASAECR
jgi:hypothetical protein